MNSNRGHYASAPLNNMKNKKVVQSAVLGAPAKEEKPQAPVRRSQWLSILMTAVLPVLFLLALFINNLILRLVFVAVSAIAVILMWAMNVFARGARSTLTMAYAMMMLIIGLAMILNLQKPESRQVGTAARVDNASELFTSKPDTDALSVFLQNNAATPEPVVYKVEETAVSSAQKQLEIFLGQWYNGSIPGMIQQCLPSWVSRQTNAEGALWNLMRNRVPTDYLVESVSGSEADTSRTISVKVTFLNEGTKDTSVFRLQVLMFRVNDVWYVDPESLDGTEVDDAAEQARAQQQNAHVNTTKAPATPTPEPAAKDAVTVFVNTNGGSYYHADQHCEKVSVQYWPLTEFTFRELEATRYINLMPCADCNAPPRP